jgi:hypothetical protein
MADDAVAEEGGAALTGGAVEELVGNDDVPGDDLLLHAADGGNRDDPFDAELLHAVDVGTEGDFRREQAVAAAMPGQKNHLHPLQGAGDIGVRRLAKGVSSRTSCTSVRPSISYRPLPPITPMVGWDIKYLREIVVQSPK